MFSDGSLAAGWGTPTAAAGALAAPPEFDEAHDRDTVPLVGGRALKKRGETVANM